MDAKERCSCGSTQSECVEGALEGTKVSVVMRRLAQGFALKLMSGDLSWVEMVKTVRAAEQAVWEEYAFQECPDQTEGGEA